MDFLNRTRGRPPSQQCGRREQSPVRWRLSPPPTTTSSATSGFSSAFLIAQPRTVRIAAGHRVSRRPRSGSRTRDPTRPRSACCLFRQPRGDCIGDASRSSRSQAPSIEATTTDHDSTGRSSLHRHHSTSEAVTTRVPKRPTLAGGCGPKAVTKPYSPPMRAQLRMRVSTRPFATHLLVAKLASDGEARPGGPRPAS